jgi:hypothetical protein
MELFCFLLGGLDYIVTVASPTNGDLRVSLMLTPLFPRFTTFLKNSFLVLQLTSIITAQDFSEKYKHD